MLYLKILFFYYKLSCYILKYSPLVFSWLPLRMLTGIFKLKIGEQLPWDYQGNMGTNLRFKFINCAFYFHKLFQILWKRYFLVLFILHEISKILFKSERSAWFIWFTRWIILVSQSYLEMYFSAYNPTRLIYNDVKTISC